MRFRVLALAAALVIVAAAPATAGDHTPSVPGAVITESTMDFETTWDSLIGILDANPAITIVAEIDHAAAAASVGLDLRPNRVVVFGNPALGTPLMQADRTVGVDLPQKIQVWEEHGRVLVAYNATDYLAARHDVAGVATLATIRGALAAISGAATGAAVDDAVGLGPVPRRPGLVTVDSPSDFATTLANLTAAIDASPASVLFTLDHAANAANAGLDLPPTTLVVFGNPAIGTPLMQSAASAGIDLPLEMLVWEDDAGVHVTYTTMRFIAGRHSLSGVRSLVETIDGVQAGLAAAATAG